MKNIWGVEPVNSMHSYNGYPLTFDYKAMAYDITGSPIGEVNVGRDTNGKLCIEDGVFESAYKIKGKVIYFYKTHDGLVGIKV